MTITISSASSRAVGRVDDERAVEALGDVLGQRPDVAVVEVQPGRQRVELVDGRAARLDLPGAEPGHAVHRRPGGCRGSGSCAGAAEPLAKRDPQPLALAAAQRRPGDPPVVGPGGELHARHDLDLLVDRDQLPLAHDAAVGSRRASCPSRSRARSRAGRSRWRRGRRRRRRGSSRDRRRGRRGPRGPACDWEWPPAATARSSAPAPSSGTPPAISRRRVSDATPRIVAYLTSYRAGTLCCRECRPRRLSRDLPRRARPETPLVRLARTGRAVLRRRR